MDVRCEKCNTEYELEEAKLKPGGVTVKCTTCGHMFKIRRRGATSTGVPAAQPQRAATASGPIPQHADAAPSGPHRARRASSQGGVDRTWLVRAEDGEIRTCRELATLQQWIVSGQATRSSEISRNGKTWKPLGDIPELAKFFQVAEEARRARTATPAGVPRHLGSTPPPQRTPAASPAPGRAPDPFPPSGAVPVAQPDAPTGPVPASAAPALEMPPPMSATARGVAPGPGNSGSVPSTERATHRATPAAAGPRLAEPPPGAQSTGAWASTRPKRASTSSGGGPSGPTGGLARGVPTHDVAFAKGRLKQPAADDLGGPTPGRDHGFAPTFDDDEPLVPPRSGIGKWVALVSLLVIGGAAAVVFLGVFRSEDGAGEQAAIAADAAAEGEPTEPTAPPEPEPGAEHAAAVALANEALRADARGELEPLATQLATLEGETLPLLLVRGRVEAALAQHLSDQAAAATDTAQAKNLARSAQGKMLAAMTVAKKALALAPEDPAANLLMGDILRLQGKAAREVERYLRKAPDGEADTQLSRALLLARDNKVRQARELLEPLATAAEDAEVRDVRPRYRLALLDFAEQKHEGARAAAEAVLELSPEHDGARALLERVREATAVVATDPMPPEVKPEPSTSGTSGSSGSSGSSSSGSSGSSGSSSRPPADTYDSLLAKADKLAESGKCGEALKVYERALDDNPIGVAALTGMGYCHLDARQFASAHRKFKAALGISPRYQPAMYGIAEAYQQQGLKPQAVEAFQRYLEEHPNGTKAEMARRQIARLGGGSGGGTDSPAPEPTPETPGGDLGGDVAGDDLGEE